jgi:uncharacterized membrane protein
MDNNPNPLTYHYESRLKLDHFLLGADVALLGWTIVNLDWLPMHIWSWVVMGIFWLLVIASLVLGVLRQIYSSSAFGANFWELHAGNVASEIERNTLQEGTFIDQQTRVPMDAEEFRKFAKENRDTQAKFRKHFSTYSNRAAWMGWWSFYFLTAGLIVLATLRILVMLPLHK